MSNHFFILLTVGMAAVTFAIRFSFIAIGSRLMMSERVRKTLRFVPVTVLPAIIAIEILHVDSNMEFNLHNPKVIAAIVSTLVSLRFGLLWVVITGTGVLMFLNKTGCLN